MCIRDRIWGDLLPLIGNHCNDMIFKNRPEDPATLEEYRSIVEKSGVERMDYLLDIIGFTPVSYTHLDVYKRQIVCRIMIIWSATGNCMSGMLKPLMGRCIRTDFSLIFLIRGISLTN